MLRAVARRGPVTIQLGEVRELISREGNRFFSGFKAIDRSLPVLSTSVSKLRTDPRDFASDPQSSASAFAFAIGRVGVERFANLGRLYWQSAVLVEAWPPFPSMIFLNHLKT